VKFEVIVRALIHDGRGRLLLGRKRPDVPHPLQGRWHFIGGRLEYDEDPWSAVVREVEEEVGVKVEPIRIVDAYPEFLEWPKESGVPSQYTLHIVFECLARDVGPLRPADDVCEAAWVEASKVGSFLDEKESLLRSARVRGFLEAVAKGAAG
jgi:8-oxo-dGTP diphosphatase